MERFNLLSIIIPAYKQEKTITNDIFFLYDVLGKLNIDYEIIVVVDGFLDDTYDKIRKIKDKKLKIYGYEKNQGKGHAVRYGMLKAKGDVVGFVDAGMDIDFHGILILMDYMKLYNADIVMCSKLHPDSQVIYPVYRKVMSWGYRAFTHILFGFNVKDTQVGLKLFKRKVVKNVFPKLLVKKFAFDVEVLAIAYSLGYTRIYEAPVKLTFGLNSSITSTTFWKIIFSMLWDTVAVFYRLKILRYYDKEK